MKVIVITFFLYYNVFLCKTLNDGILKDTYLTNGTDALLHRAQKQLKKEKALLRSKDNGSIGVPKFRQRDDVFSNYNVPELFWGGQTELSKIPTEYTTTTFLPTREVSYTPEGVEENAEITEVPEEIDDNTWPHQPNHTINANYPVFPYETFPHDDPKLQFIVTREAYDATERNFKEPAQVYGEIYPVKESDSNKYYVNQSYYPTFVPFDGPIIKYSVITEAFASSVTLPPDIDMLYTLKSVPTESTVSTDTPLTLATAPLTCPIWTTKYLFSKYFQRNAETPNLKSISVTISDKDMDSVRKRFNKVTTGKPVQKRFSSWDGLTTSVTRKINTLSKSQLWLQRMKNFGVPVYREDSLSDPKSTPLSLDRRFSTNKRQTARYIPQTAGNRISRATPHYDPLTHTTVVAGLPITAQILNRDIGIAHTPVPSPRQAYFKMMEEKNEGFLPIFLLEILRITFEKDKKPVKEVLLKVEPHIKTWYATDRLTWFGQPLADMIVKFSRFLTTAQADLVRNYSSIMYHSLKMRKTAVAEDLNSIIDYADMLYTDGEGWELFEAIMEYDRYPNGTKNSKQLCEFIIDCFMRPYRRLSHSERGKTLFNSVNSALKIRFPTRRSMEDIFKIEPQTTIQIKSKYLQGGHGLRRGEWNTKYKKQEAVDDVEQHFLSRLENIKSYRRTSKYLKNLKTPVLNNYYIFTATKTNEEASNDKVINNEDKETLKYINNQLFNASIENQKENEMDVESRIDKNPYFNDFDDK